jgi:deoxyuridine 5'-triphosphate nucleotidohydrolase
MLPDQWLNDIRYRNLRGFDFAPKKQGDVGHDLHVDMTGMKKTLLDRIISAYLRESVIVVLPFTNRALASGIFLAMPDDIWAKIEARSSASKKGLVMAGGIIDSGYRGEMFTVMQNNGLVPRVIRDSERYAQVIFHCARRPDLCEVPFFTDATSRGDTGFGSSGK